MALEQPNVLKHMVLRVRVRVSVRVRIRIRNRVRVRVRVRVKGGLVSTHTCMQSRAARAAV